MLAADAANVGHRDARLLPVGSFTANGFGLYDVNGNAAELAADCWRDSPAALPGDARPARAGWTCPQRALRDGSAAEPVAAVRLSARRPIAPDARMAGVGFRVMREVR